MKSHQLAGLVLALMSLPWFWHVHRLLGNAHIYNASDLVFATIVLSPGLALIWLGLEVADQKEIQE